jgi:hypothetical protein
MDPKHLKRAIAYWLVYICDWLPPDFGAVGQYAVLFARQWASDGGAVTLVGLTSGPSNRQAAEPGFAFIAPW